MSQGTLILHEFIESHVAEPTRNDYVVVLIENRCVFGQRRNNLLNNRKYFTRILHAEVLFCPATLTQDKIYQPHGAIVREREFKVEPGIFVEVAVKPLLAGYHDPKQATKHVNIDCRSWVLNAFWKIGPSR